jgi:membrane protein required for colicin V production
MNWFDIFLVVVAFIFTWKGFRAGLVGSIGGFFGVIFGIWAGSHYMQQAGAWIMEMADFNNEYLGTIAGFLAIFAAVNIAVSIIVSVINRVFHIIPFIDLLNKLLGATVGLITGALAVSSIVYIMSLLPISDAISGNMLDSELADIALKIAFVVKPFIPAAIKELKSIFEYVN